MEPNENQGSTDPQPASVPPPHPGSPSPEGTPSTPTGLSKDDRLWASLAHLGGIITSFIGPLVIWFVKREESAFVDNQAKEAANFQISVAIVMVVAFVLMFIPVINCIVWIVPI